MDASDVAVGTKVVLRAVLDSGRVGLDRDAVALELDTTVQPKAVRRERGRLIRSAEQVGSPRAADARRFAASSVRCLAEAQDDDVGGVDGDWLAPTEFPQPRETGLTRSGRVRERPFDLGRGPLHHEDVAAQEPDLRARHRS